MTTTTIEQNTTGNFLSEVFQTLSDISKPKKSTVFEDISSNVQQAQTAIRNKTWVVKPSKVEVKKLQDAVDVLFKAQEAVSTLLDANDLLVNELKDNDLVEIHNFASKFILDDVKPSIDEQLQEAAKQNGLVDTN